MSVYNPVGGIVWAAPDAVSNFNWINTISAGLTALGLPINGAVSGQISLGGGSVAIPGTITNGTLYPMGYEVRQMISSGLPTLQLRIDYKLISLGTTAAALYPVVVVTVGTTVNTSTGVVGGAATTAGASTPGNTIYSGNANTASRPLFMSSDGANYLTFTVDPARSTASPTTTCACIVLDRSVTAATGAYNANGYQLISLSNSVVTGVADGAGCWNVNLTSALCTYVANYGVTFPGSMFTGSGTGTAATVAPVSVMLPAAQGPMFAAIGYYRNDVADGTTFPVMIYGSNHTYLACAVTYQSFSQAPTTAGTTTGFGAQRLAMRYE